MGECISCVNCTHARTLYNELSGRIEAIECNSHDESVRFMFKTLGKKENIAEGCYEYISLYSTVTISKIEPSQAIVYLLAGNSDFMLKSHKTQVQFRLRLVRKKSKSQKMEEKYGTRYELHWYDEPNRRFLYAGNIYYTHTLTGFIYHQDKGLIDAQNSVVRGVIYVLNKLLFGKHSELDVDICHLGNCSRCGRKLTTPESIQRGMGADCYKAVIGDLNRDLVIKE